jgi:glucan phosphoethanolaminetransferase (alkaline phosphatase superfamily)
MGKPRWLTFDAGHLGSLVAVAGSALRLPDAASPRDRRRARARRARLAGVFALLAPALLVLGADVAFRARQIAGFDRLHRAGYVASVLGTASLWGLLLYVVASRRSRLRGLAVFVFVVLFATSAGVQAAFRATYNVYLSIDALLFSVSLPLAITGNLPVGRALVLGLSAGVLVACALVVLARRLVRPRRIRPKLRPWLAAVAVGGAFNAPVSYRNMQSTTPDLIYFQGLGAMIHEKVAPLFTHEPQLVRVRRRTPEPVPPLAARPARPRNVLLLLQESQRADATCIEYRPRCPLATRATNDLAPRRIGFYEMRAAASSTAVAISNLWAGVDPFDTREQLLSAPLVWDYAHAAGWDTAYWTSQNLMFGNARLYVMDLPLSHFAGGNDLDPEADWLVGARDARLSERVIADFASLREPFFAVVHYSNVHRPRLYDPALAPFQPSYTYDQGTAGANGKNHYLNAVYASDVAVAKLLEHVRSTDKGRRTVVVYTSDHAESFREHDNENDHSATVYDEEIRVPAWIDAPPGTLSPAEEASLRGARHAPAWQYDLGATLLDLVGVWDDPAFARFRGRMIGHPLTRPERTTAPVPMTNTSWIWEYVEPNWGFMQGTRKLLATSADTAYHCFDVAADPKERNDLGEAGCPELAALAREKLRVLPRDVRHLAAHPEWPPAR